jgi:hypothetical protein
MLAITVKAKGRDPHKFEWNGSSEEFHKLWDDMERLADGSGQDPIEAANAIILAATHENEIARGHAVWIVYAVLRHAADNIDLTGFIDHAGVLAGPPTIFDLAEHQHIKAEISIDNNHATIKLTGSSPLDS